MKWNFKKSIVCLFIITMLLGKVIIVDASSKNEIAVDDTKVTRVVGSENKIEELSKRGIIEGYEDGELKLERNISRAEFVKILVYAANEKENALSLSDIDSKYIDVEKSHWANGVINSVSSPSMINKQIIIGGYPDGTFQAEKNITYAELAKMLVVLSKTDLTKEQIDSANKSWPNTWINMANEQEIFKDVKYSDVNKKANRADAFTMFYNALSKLETLENYESILNKVYTDEEVANIKKDVFNIEDTEYTIKDLKPEINTSMFGNIIEIKGENIPENLKNKLLGNEKLAAHYYAKTSKGKEIVRNAEFEKDSKGNYISLGIDVITEELIEEIQNSKIYIKLK